MTMDPTAMEGKENVLSVNSSAGQENRGEEAVRPMPSPTSAESTLCNRIETDELPRPPAQSTSKLDDSSTEPRHVESRENFLAKHNIEYDYDDVEGHRILRLRPTLSQWEDFPTILEYARVLGTESDGCFKVVIPEELNDPLPEKSAVDVAANAYKPKLIRKTTFWQVSTVPSLGTFESLDPGPQCTDTVEAALKTLKHLFRKSQNRQLRNVRYRVDVPAWTEQQRREAGVPSRSPIYPLKGDKLDRTKAIIPGIHTPYVYESGPYFGATFQIHAEDFRLASLNHLYKGRKIWIVVPATAVDVAEKALGRGSACSQFMRHRAEFFFPDKLEKLGIPYRIVDQRPGETIVILPDAYHEGFSTGYTIAEAKNYADPSWSTDSYQPCEAACKLLTAIPASLMRPIEDGEDRLDLCAAYSAPRATEQPEGQVPAQAEQVKPAEATAPAEPGMAAPNQAELGGSSPTTIEATPQRRAACDTAPQAAALESTAPEKLMLITPPASRQDKQCAQQSSDKSITVQAVPPSACMGQAFAKAPSDDQYTAAVPVTTPQLTKRNHDECGGVDPSTSYDGITVGEPGKRIKV